MGIYPLAVGTVIGSVLEAALVGWWLGRLRGFRVPTMAWCHSGRAASVESIFSYRGGVFFDGQHEFSGAIHGGDVGLRQRCRVSLWQQNHIANFRHWVR